jgi:Rrf2 family protein
MRLALTRRGDYAVRAMLALAADHDDAWLSVPRISESMHIPGRFLPRVMAELTRAGLVVGRPGRTGGYRLARPADAISLLDVIAALEPEPEPRSCVLRGSPCGVDGRCAVHDAFTDAREAMLDRLDTVSLAQVATPAGPTGRADPVPPTSG